MNMMAVAAEEQCMIEGHTARCDAMHATQAAMMPYLYGALAIELAILAALAIKWAVRKCR